MPDACCKNSFSAPFALFYEGSSEASSAVVALPAEQATDDKLLRGLEVKGLSFVSAPVQLQHRREEPGHSLYSVQIPSQAALVAFFEISKVASAGLADIGPGHDLAVHNALCICGYSVDHFSTVGPKKASAGSMTSSLGGRMNLACVLGSIPSDEEIARMFVRFAAVQSEGAASKSA